MPEVSDLDTGPRALNPDEARALLRECATVVAPGETLVIRVPATWYPDQVQYYQEYLSARAGGAFSVVVALGDDIAVARPDPAELEKAVAGIVERELSRRAGCR